MRLSAETELTARSSIGTFDGPGAASILGLGSGTKLAAAIRAGPSR